MLFNTVLFNPVLPVELTPLPVIPFALCVIPPLQVIWNCAVLRKLNEWVVAVPPTNGYIALNLFQRLADLSDVTNVQTAPEIVGLVMPVAVKNAAQSGSIAAA